MQQIDKGELLISETFCLALKTTTTTTTTTTTKTFQ